MSDGYLIVGFLFFTALVNILISSVVTDTGSTSYEVNTETGVILSIYLDIAEFIQSIEIPYATAIINIFTLGLFSEFITNLVQIYYYMPGWLATLIFLPQALGAIYAIVKAFPTT